MGKSKLKVMTIIGTRPEIIRLACVMQELDKYVNQIIVHTGQNYDYELNEIFFKELEIRKPDHFMNVDTSSLGNVLGGILIKAEEIMRAEQPDAVLILGDTNSSIAGIIAKRMKIPIYHMEAGNRCFDQNVPEEINRKIIDHIADFNLVYTEHARRHLLSEGLQHRRIYLTGSPMYEVLHKYEDKITSSKVLEELGLEDKNYFAVSAHREENVDDPAHLRSILTVLNTLAKEYDVPVIVSTHPRTRKRLESVSDVEMDPRVRFLKPFGFFDYVHLEMHALCSISDSGTISEEAAVMKFPAVTIREAIERPEALDTGSIIMTGLDADVVLASIALVIDKHGADAKRQIPAEYAVENTAERVVKLVLGTAGLSNGWWGIRS
ncbi:non-hydrolyzing UDP-N-acetylglucosamine 2-epimerase [Methanocorpusculum sp. GPch4]|uniref:non-hydrolyzing UDP-N-acetylglucosamine 2-epimerase n=1 Tax=Methanocorpusculum sp. GPch4 TaxID=2527877 RepID=UPI0014330A67|nr:UDP-N-acetylglucosamine 2-epimerase (non-hydrolyzing) [Methanocorpusculum sp. GPch4]